MPARAERQTTVERARAVVDLAALERNCARLRAAAPEAALCAVVKADGYGHGAAECARAAIDGGATWLAVAAAGEASELRAAGLTADILVMGALTRAELEEALAAGADIVAWTAELLDWAAEAVDARRRRARLHVKLDTGMGRLGTNYERAARELCDAVAADERLELAGLMTHFATADEPGDSHFPAQLERFRRFVDDVRATHAAVVCHAANSAATLRDRASHFDMVRCGVGIYGLDPFQSDPYARNLEPVMTLESYVAAVKRFAPGVSAGYGRTWRATAETDVAVVPVGYGDGVRRALSNNADVLVGGRRRPLVGTVSMDNVTVDLGLASGVQAGDPVVLIGAQHGERILCEEVARRIGTINYEVTCGISRRVPRVHTRG